MPACREISCRSTIHLASEANVAFLIGTFLFVVIVGALDARLPWPRPKQGGRKQ
jgi:hypothetical protein